MATLALVPARGGSKSIPLKNLKPLGGRPLIEWCLDAIAASGVVERTVVSTDDERIAEVARAAGADVPFLRPAQLAADDTPSIDVVDHALRWLEENEGATPELVLLVQPTEPFVQPEQITQTLELMLKRGADSAITMTEVPRNNHPYHVRERTDDGWLSFEQPDAHRAHPTRQDDPPRWAFGNLYWFRREAFLATRRLETDKHVGLPIDAVSALDLNTPDDWALAEALLPR
ncbi:MAG TPA: acylneuraminate cytidylyltransferase family protein [Gaiellaceae bacterium]|nr:acylneuraminate cytidylyltransferase family protein [Gaiellaceae bacterium]